MQEDQKDCYTTLDTSFSDGDIQHVPISGLSCRCSKRGISCIDLWLPPLSHPVMVDIYLPYYYSCCRDFLTVPFNPTQLAETLASVATVSREAIKIIQGMCEILRIFAWLVMYGKTLSCPKGGGFIRKGNNVIVMHTYVLL